MQVVGPWHATTKWRPLPGSAPRTLLTPHTPHPTPLLPRSYFTRAIAAHPHTPLPRSYRTWATAARTPPPLPPTRVGPRHNDWLQEGLLHEVGGNEVGVVQHVRRQAAQPVADDGRQRGDGLLQAVVHDVELCVVQHVVIHVRLAGLRGGGWACAHSGGVGVCECALALTAVTCNQGWYMFVEGRRAGSELQAGRKDTRLTHTHTLSHTDTCTSMYMHANRAISPPPPPETWPTAAASGGLWLRLRLWF